MSVTICLFQNSLFIHSGPVWSAKFSKSLSHFHSGTALYFLFVCVFSARHENQPQCAYSQTSEHIPECHHASLKCDISTQKKKLQKKKKKPFEDAKRLKQPENQRRNDQTFSISAPRSIFEFVKLVRAYKHTHTCAHAHTHHKVPLNLHIQNSCGLQRRLW